MREMGRAKEKAVKSIIDSRPDAFLHSHPPSLQPSPVSDDERDPHHPADPHADDHNGNEEQDAGWKDEEEVALESAYTLQDHLVHPNPDNSHPPPDNPSQPSAPPQPRVQTRHMTRPQAEGQNSCDDPDHHGHPTHSSDQEHNAANTPSNTAPADESTSQKASVESPESSSKPREACQEDESPHHVPPPDAERGPAVRARARFAIRHSAPLRPSGFIEDEAEDEDGSSGRDSSATPERDDSLDGDEGVADGVDEHEVSAAERQKLVAFHQKWLLQRETEEVNALKADPRSMLDKEDEEFMASGVDAKVDEADTAQDEGAASGSEAAEGDLDVDLDLDDGSRPANYVESMYVSLLFVTFPRLLGSRAIFY